jgi:hypothetical protein
MSIALNHMDLMVSSRTIIGRIFKAVNDINGPILERQSRIIFVEMYLRKIQKVQSTVIFMEPLICKYYGALHL